MTNELLMKLGLDSSAFQQGLKDANTQLKESSAQFKKDFGELQKQVEGIGKAMIAAGAAITAGLVAVTVSSNKAGAAIYDLSLKTGFSTEALSKWKYAAEQSGTSLDTVALAIRQVATVMNNASNAAADAVDPFKVLGFTFKDLQGLSPEDQFTKIALAVASIQDPMTRSAIAVQMFGRAGTDMLPLLAEGADGIKALGDKATALNVVFSTDTAKAAKAFDDSTTDLKTSLDGLKTKIATAITPELQGMIDKFTGIITKITDFVAKNPELVRQLLSLGIALAAAGIALIAVSKGIALIQSLTGPAGLLKVSAALLAFTLAWKGVQDLTGDLGIKTPDLPKTETPEEPQAPKVPNTPSTSNSQSWIDKRREALLAGGYQAPDITLPGAIQPIPFSGLPSFAKGGIIPGPVGKPTPIMAHGGEAFLGVGNNMPQPVNISLSFGNYMGDDLSRRNLMRDLAQFFGENTRRTSFGHLNKTYFAGTSSI